ncbi:MAG: SDR family NAD(P)-dependent oxidoreductase [Fibrobacter sp.]|nr:SDR family NAD(P)-dependent oxidoreductase [Fibrobacter sp.]
MDLYQKVIIITGASEGIGAALVQELSHHDTQLVLCSRSRSKLESLRLPANSKKLIIPTDVSNIDDVTYLIESTIQHFGRIDILINNAGIGYSSTVEHINQNDISKLLSVNLFGPLYTMQQVIPVMRKQGGGLIINISSMISRIATSGSGGYRASKMALEAISDAARLELKKDNIRVITAYPGLTSTNFFNNSIGCNSTQNRTTGGQQPQKVAKKIVNAIKKEPRSIFMGPAALLRGSIAQLFPSIAEKLTIHKKKIHQFLNGRKVANTTQ